MHELVQAIRSAGDRDRGQQFRARGREERQARLAEMDAKLKSDQQMGLEDARRSLAELVMSIRKEYDLFDREQALKLQTGTGI